MITTSYHSATNIVPFPSAGKAFPAPETPVSFPHFRIGDRVAYTSTDGSKGQGFVYSVVRRALRNQPDYIYVQMLNGTRRLFLSTALKSAGRDHQ